MKTLLACAILGLAGGIGRASGVPASALSKHRYRSGERLSYFFEDTETTFGAGLRDSALQPTTLEQIEEFQLAYTITVKNNHESLHRVLEFESGMYRKGEPPAFSTTSLRDIVALIPGFPALFSYEYENDGQAVKVAAPRAYAPYMSDPIGSFVYYKALDVHTIQSVIDGLPPALKAGELVQEPASDIKLPGGTFHNASAAILYQRVVPCEKVRCASLKAVTMGNSFTQRRPDGSAHTLYTNYQYTFLVPLEGPRAGLLLHGDLQETVTSPPDSIVQRQLSITLKGNSL